MGLIGSDVNMHFMDPTEYVPISPIYYVIWYNWCTMLLRCAGREQLPVRVDIHRYSTAGILCLHMFVSNCLTLSFSCRNINLYLFTLKYSTVENESWDSSLSWYEVSCWTPVNLGSETLLLPGFLTFPLERGPDSWDRSPTGSWFWAEKGKLYTD